MSTPTTSRVVEVAVPLVAALAAGLVARALLSGPGLPPIGTRATSGPGLPPIP